MDINWNEIVRLISPGEGQDFLWSIFLYLCFFFTLITLFLIPDKNLLATLLTAGTLLFILVAKISLAAPDPIFERKEFGMLIINIWIGVIPLIVAGMIRTRKRNNPALPMSIIAGLIGMGYFMMFWALVQRV